MSLVSFNSNQSLPIPHQNDGLGLFETREIIVIGALLLLGGLVLLANRIKVVARTSFFNNQLKPKDLSLDQAFTRMRKNSEKAITEHIAKNVSSEPYATVFEALPSIEEMNKKSPSLKFSHCVKAEQGVREEMEDVHFYKETPEGIITGVFDGHAPSEELGINGAAVAESASRIIQSRFFDLLKKTNHNVRRTFEWLFNEIQQEIIKNKNLDWIGATAVVCFIDTKTNLIYTATLGDSEANIYRTIHQELKSVPLSCVRDWTSPKDAERAGAALERFDGSRHPKDLRYKGLNLSRAFGDFYTSGISEKSAIIHKPKVTVNQLQAGDVLILACDGLKDYVSEQEVTTILTQHQTDQAKPLVDWALKDKSSTDNITVVAINVN